MLPINEWCILLDYCTTISVGITCWWRWGHGRRGSDHSVDGFEGLGQGAFLGSFLAGL